MSGPQANSRQDVSPAPKQIAHANSERYRAIKQQLKQKKKHKFGVFHVNDNPERFPVWSARRGNFPCLRHSMSTGSLWLAEENRPACNAELMQAMGWLLSGRHSVPIRKDWRLTQLLGNSMHLAVVFGVVACGLSCVGSQNAEPTSPPELAEDAPSPIKVAKEPMELSPAKSESSSSCGSVRCARGPAGRAEVVCHTAEMAFANLLAKRRRVGVEPVMSVEDRCKTAFDELVNAAGG